MNIWEMEYYKQIEKFKEEYQEQIESDFKCEKAELINKIYNILDEKIEPEIRDNIMGEIDNMKIFCRRRK